MTVDPSCQTFLAGACDKALMNLLARRRAADRVLQAHSPFTSAGSDQINKFPSGFLSIVYTII